MCARRRDPGGLHRRSDRERPARPGGGREGCADQAEVRQSRPHGEPALLLRDRDGAGLHGGDDPHRLHEHHGDGDGGEDLRPDDAQVLPRTGAEQAGHVVGGLSGERHLHDRARHAR